MSRASPDWGGIFLRKFNESFRIFANIQMSARRFVCRFGERWSIGFHTLLSIDAIETQFTFLPLRICGNGRAIGAADNNAQSIASAHQAGAPRQRSLLEATRGPCTGGEAGKVSRNSFKLHLL